MLACTFVNTRLTGNGLVSFACVLTNNWLEYVCICISIDLTEPGPFARRFSVSTAPQPNRRYKLASLLKRRGGQAHSALSPNAECDLIRHATPICAPAQSQLPPQSQHQQQSTASPQILLLSRAMREEQERLDAEFARQLQEGLDMMVESGGKSLHGAGGNRSVSHASPKVSVSVQPNSLTMKSGAAAGVNASLAAQIAASPLPSECEGPRSTRKTLRPHNRPFAAKSHADAALDAVFRLHCSPHQRHRSSHAAAATQPEPLRAANNRNTANSAAYLKSSQITVPRGEKENLSSISGLSELDAIRIENEQLRESLASMRVPPSPRIRTNVNPAALESVPTKRTKPSLIDRLRCGIEALGCAASSSNASVASPFKIHHATKPEAFSGF